MIKALSREVEAQRSSVCFISCSFQRLGSTLPWSWVLTIEKDVLQANTTRKRDIGPGTFGRRPNM